MTHSETVFLNLLRYSIHPDAMPQFDNVEWEQIVEISKKQNLFPLIFDAASSLPGFEQIEKKYFQEVAERMSVQMQNTSDFLKLYTAFLEDGISPIVLKGIVCRELYGEKGDLRVSGDEDVLIKKSDYDTAYQTLKRCGYETKDVPDKEMELIQEVTFYNPDTKLTIELHLNLFGGGESIRTAMNSNSKTSALYSTLFDMNSSTNLMNLLSKMQMQHGYRISLTNSFVVLPQAAEAHIPQSAYIHTTDDSNSFQKSNC